ncbi:flagellar assembly protein FliH [Aquipseudomonas alcaligenes]|uniref:Flagellar assembly protein FliH n=1 Tax=Aquipseudomonas alcaligenes TaxID=43263 RepID=A0AA37FKJ7_AQUAC|nr:flagellar assembly protein FliH [Pseudomonas alcaligenes]BCR24841.1 flagellar assembly protein FliH [Pseudomonas alcaligenes]GIZ66045.1 flagellar assembly protein FliH [Pseudomonas alcaligenes]GIZ70362.1 flagellar assembly protein FliH [Pseudomonas alcaligenes]GIZ74715.1 flagellar assembly protein FliH [Pseudomonas alcaligenes]GIZ79059.1 flagellar assembly protein FliH [Pseudomonas alcaligenes]
MAAKEAPSELIRAKDVAVFDRWAIPSFDPQVEEAPEPEPQPEPEPEPQIEEVAVEDVKPLTLEELEAIRQEAYNEGFATGEKDGFHAGQLKAKQEAEVALAAKIASLEELMGHLLEPIANQDRELEQGLVNLVSQMTRQVIQRELATDSSQIRHVLREALKLLPMGASNIRIHVHPQDFELVKALRERHEESWRILEDESLQPGGCRVESESSRIDASVETRLATALKQLFEQQRAQATNPPEADIQVDLESPDAP